MAGLLDFLQAASNEAASNVSGPIDLLSWALKKGGVPVGDAPMLGSEWMKRQGLMRDVPQSAASLAGETFGLLAPIGAAAKAPQIAAGLLRAQDAAAQGAKAVGTTAADMTADYMARQGLLQPATVWHGSPHKFDKFDASKIGTGEGAQAYGHGLYLADAPDVAQSYQALGHMQGNVGTVGKTPIHDFYSQIENKANQLPPKAAAEYYDRLAMLEDLMSNTYPTKVLENAKANGYSPNAIAWLEKQVLPKYSPAGNMYKVDLPDTAIAKMLDWDKPLSQQAPEVQKALGPMFGPNAAELTGQDLYKKAAAFDSMANVAAKTGGDVARMKTVFPQATDAQIRQAIAAAKNAGGNDKIAAGMLRDAGIPGIRYLDGGSRGAGQGTSNYVVFPGNEGLLTILERNGVPLK